MSKIERNDPCHCGSGKKYKKCCLVADQASEAALHKHNDDFFSHEIEPDTEMIRSYGAYDGVFGEDSDSDNWNDATSVEVGLPFPEVSAEDEAFIENWYKKIEKIKKPIEILKAAEQFMDEYPSLVPAWGFEDEYLLDLKTNCVKQGLNDELLNFLMLFRKRFPDVYQRMFGYHDSDLIYYSIINGNLNEIPSLLVNFELYPEAFLDKMFEMLNILAVKGESALLVPFIKKIHKRVVDSYNILDGYEILTPLMYHIEGKYIGPNQTDAEYSQFCNEIKDSVDVKIKEQFLQEEYWKTEHSSYFADAGIFSCNLKIKNERNSAYSDFLKKFQWHLFHDLKKDWVSAFLICFELNAYFWFILDEKIVSNDNYFVLDKKSLDRYISLKLKEFMWLNSYRTNALLTGVWYFAEFLVKTQNTNESTISDVRKTCIELHAMEQNINIGNLESLVFNKFPMW